MPTLPFRLSKKRTPAEVKADQRAQDERNIRQMERYYTEREEVMSPMRAETTRVSPAREDYRLFKRLRSNRRSGGR